MKITFDSSCLPSPHPSRIIRSTLLFISYSLIFISVSGRDICSTTTDKDTTYAPNTVMFSVKNLLIFHPDISAVRLRLGIVLCNVLIINGMLKDDSLNQGGATFPVMRWETGVYRGGFVSLLFLLTEICNFTP